MSFTLLKLNNAIASMSCCTKMMHRDDFIQEADKKRQTLCSTIPGAMSFYQIPCGSVFYFPENKWLMELTAIYMIDALHCVPIKFLDELPQKIFIRRSSGEIQKAFCSPLSGLVFSESRSDFKLNVCFNTDDDTTSELSVFSPVQKNVLLSDVMKLNYIDVLKITIPRVSEKLQTENETDKEDAAHIENKCIQMLTSWIDIFNTKHNGLTVKLTF